METASLIVWLASLWLYAGAAVAALFLLIGIGRIDEDARGTYSFRPLLIPGIMLLWPLVLWRWWTLESGSTSWQSSYRPLRAAHARVWFVLAILIPLIFVGSLVVRQAWPVADGARQLEAPRQ